MSIQYQADFWLRNVHNFDPEEFSTEQLFSDELIEGFQEFSSLLRRIYSDYQSFEISTVEPVLTKIGIMSDDLDNYHNLTDTINFFYKIASLGELQSDGC